MTPTTLLVPVREHEAFEDADRAVALCADTARHLSFVVYAEAPPPPLLTAQASAETALWAESVSGVAEALHMRAEALRERLEPSGVSHDVDVAFHEGGATARELGARARRADVTVIARHVPRGDALERHLLSGALFHSARPLLLVPEAATPTLASRRVLVGWDGGLAAARALEAALPICRAADEVTLASVDGRGDERGDLRTAGPGSESRDVLAWLRRHGVSPKLERRDGDGERAAETLLGLADRARADLVVAGAYGRSEVRERWFGGTTRSLIEDCPTALLLAH